MGVTGLFRRLGEILVRERLTTPDVVDQALVRARTTGERVGEALVSLGAVKDDDVLRALAQQQNLAYLNRDERRRPCRSSRISRPSTCGNTRCAP
jgi:hypothetical protein